MARPKVLLVDDNQELLRLLARLIDAEEAERLYGDMGPAIETSGGWVSIPARATTSC